MRFTTIFFVLGIYLNLAFCQKILYKPIFINQCTGVSTDSIYWYVSDSVGNVYIPSDSSNNVLSLPKVGVYTLYIGFLEDSDKVSINKIGLNTDTFFTKKVRWVSYISDPQVTEYYDCDTPADGFVLDYYYNGRLRLSGYFKNGQLVDTLKEFYSNGVIKFLNYPNKKKRQWIHFYKNGNIKSDYNSSKRYNKEYYETGELKVLERWNIRGTIFKNEYFQLGQIKKSQNRNRQIKYDSNGKIVQFTKRKKTIFLEKFVHKDEIRWYDFQSKTFDSIGNVLMSVQYSAQNYEWRRYYPDIIKQNKDYHFDEIVFYQNGIENKKIDFKYIKNNNDFVRYLILYKLENGIWIEKETSTEDNIYKYLGNLIID